MKVPLPPCGDCDHPAVYLSLSLCQQMTKSFHGGRLQEPRGCFRRSTELCLINGRSIEMPPPWALEHRERFHTFPKVQEAGRSEESTSFPGAGEGGWQQAGTLINRKGPAGATHWLQRKSLLYPPAPSITPRGQGQAGGQKTCTLIG